MAKMGELKRAYVRRERKARLCAELSESLVDSVHEAWFQGLVQGLTEQQVRARIQREHQALRAAGTYRAALIARRGIGQLDG